VSRQIVLVEGLCIEIPEVLDFFESQYAAIVDPAGQGAGVALALDRLTATLNRMESVLASHDRRLLNLERPS
jgi:hypothetical protein